MPTYFAVTFKEQNGEQEYYHDMIIEAKNFEEALEKAEAHAKNWYEDEEVDIEVDEVGNKTFDFIYMGIAVRVDRVKQTTIKEWCKRQFEVSLIQ